MTTTNQHIGNTPVSLLAGIGLSNLRAHLARFPSLQTEALIVDLQRAQTLMASAMVGYDADGPTVEVLSDFNRASARIFRLLGQHNATQKLLVRPEPVAPPVPAETQGDMA